MAFVAVVIVIVMSCKITACFKKMWCLWRRNCSIHTNQHALIWSAEYVKRLSPSLCTSSARLHAIHMKFTASCLFYCIVLYLVVLYVLHYLRRKIVRNQSAAFCVPHPQAHMNSCHVVLNITYELHRFRRPCSTLSIFSLPRLLALTSAWALCVSVLTTFNPTPPDVTKWCSTQCSKQRVPLCTCNVATCRMLSVFVRCTLQEVVLWRLKHTFLQVCSVCLGCWPRSRHLLVCWRLSQRVRHRLWLQLFWLSLSFSSSRLSALACSPTSRKATS